MRNNSETFVADLLRAMPSPGAKMACTTVLYRWGGFTIYIPAQSQADRRRRAAENMLANGMESAAVVQAISERFNVTQRTAYRDVETARKMSGACVINGASNSGTSTT